MVFKDKFGQFADRAGRRWKNEVNLPVGAMWICEESKTLGVKLPGICGLNRFAPNLEYNKHRWRVTGDPPNLTVTPSINSVGEYHGYLTDGVLSDDLDGRAYSENGLRQP